MSAPSQTIPVRSGRVAASRTCIFTVLLAFSAMSMTRGAWADLAAAQDGTSAATQQTTNGNSTATATKFAADLVNPALEPALRVEAAARLLNRPPEEAQAALSREFGEDKAPASVAYFARAVADHPAAPAWCIAPLARALPAAPPEAVPTILSALGSFFSRDAVEPIIRFLQSQPAPEQLPHAFNALVRQTGNEAPGTDVNAWATWWAEVQWIPEGDWRLRIAAAHAARSARITRERDALTARVVDMLGRMHGATPVDQRSALLASMLRDDLVEVRNLGLELALRALANAQPLDQSVTAAAFDCLAHPNPVVRAGAMRLLENLSPEDGHPRLLEALMAERDPRVAAPLLRLLAKRPTVGYAQDALRWLEQSGPVRDAAADALLALHRAGALPDEGRTRAISTIRSIEPDRFSAGVVRLFGAIGDAGDVPTLEELLRIGDRAVRIAAADAVALYPHGVDPLLRAAGSDPELLDAAVRAVVSHRNTAAGYFALGPIAAGAGERGAAAMQRVASSLPLAQALMVAEATAPDAQEAFIVSALRDRASLRENERAAKRLVSLLAQRRMDRADATGALDAFERLRAEQIAPDNGAVRTQLIALLTLDRLDEAAALNGGASDWLDGLERCVALPHARRIHDHIVGAFDGALDEAAAARLASIAARLPAAAGPEQAPSTPNAEDDVPDGVATPSEVDQGLAGD